MSNRREFTFLLGGAAVAWPIAAQAQRRRPLVGWLQTQSLTGSTRFASAFLQGMADLGYMEGRDVDFERRYADGDLKSLPILANELVKLQPDVILTTTSAATLALTKATPSIPIVATTMVDPVSFGFAANPGPPWRTGDRHTYHAGQLAGKATCDGTGIGPWRYEDWTAGKSFSIQSPLSIGRVQKMPPRPWGSSSCQSKPAQMTKLKRRFKNLCARKSIW